MKFKGQEEAMEVKNVKALFTDETLKMIFPAQRADQFFEALYGDVEEGAYDISLKFKDHDPAQKNLIFLIELIERKGKCLVCNLTYGLPEVFSRHPIINIKGIVREIEKLLGKTAEGSRWSLGKTLPVSNTLHAIPLIISLK